MEILLKYFPGLTEKQLQQFAELKSLYTEWNEKINVISRKDMDNFYEHHVLHSLAIAAQFEFPGGYKILDIGTGGGFPGIPLAIFFPDVKFHLVDSINKKIMVVNEVAAAIGLSNVTTQHTRAEALNKSASTAGTFDVAVSRAVAPLKELWYWSHPLLKKKTVDQYSKGVPGTKKLAGLICLKGGDLANEISESGLHPQAWEIEKIYDEVFFKEKYILYVPK